MCCLAKSGNVRSTKNILISAETSCSLKSIKTTNMEEAMLKQPLLMNPEEQTTTPSDIPAHLNSRQNNSNPTELEHSHHVYLDLKGNHATDFLFIFFCALLLLQPRSAAAASSNNSLPHQVHGEARLPAEGSGKAWLMFSDDSVCGNVPPSPRPLPHPPSRTPFQWATNGPG